MISPKSLKNYLRAAHYSVEKIEKNKNEEHDY